MDESSNWLIIIIGWGVRLPEHRAWFSSPLCIGEYIPPWIIKELAGEVKPSKCMQTSRFIDTGFKQTVPAQFLHVKKNELLLSVNLKKLCHNCQ